MNEIHHDISYIWTRVNKRWLAAGALAGMGAGLAMLAAAAVLTYFYLPREMSFPAKLIGAAMLGASALQIDARIGMIAGLAIHFGLSGFFGLAFAQCVWEESRRRVLFLLSTLTGLALWLFGSMMLMPAFNETMFYLLPKPVSLLLHVVFGVSFGILIVGLRRRLLNENGT